MHFTEQAKSTVCLPSVTNCSFFQISNGNSVYEKMFMPLTWQGLVCVWELLNFRGDGTKKLFKK